MTGTTITRWADISTGTTQTPPPGTVSGAGIFTQYTEVNYTGDGTTSKLVATGFVPKRVIIFSLTFNSGNSSEWYLAATSGDWCIELRSNSQVDLAGHAADFPFQSTGFDVGKGNQISGVNCNTSATSYRMLVWG